VNKFSIINNGFDPDIGDYLIDVKGPSGETSITFFGPDADDLATVFLEALCKKSSTNSPDVG